MMSLQQIREVNRARREGAPLGDIAVLKFAMIAGPAVEQNQRLAGLHRAYFEPDLERLRALPDGTVGREYVRHLDRYGLNPLQVSPAMKERHADHPYAMRATSTHDLLHALTGFPTTPAGELGLFAFMVGQGFGPGKGTLLLSTVVYALLLPLHLVGLLRNLRVGLKMSAEAEPLLEAPLESLLDVPIDEARARLGLRPERIAAIDPGKRSLLMDALVPQEREPATA
ncbi:MAG: Coq4 family protein [Nannocystaceae bacterium]